MARFAQIAFGMSAGEKSHEARALADAAEAEGAQVAELTALQIGLPTLVIQSNLWHNFVAPDRVPPSPCLEQFFCRRL